MHAHQHRSKSFSIPILLAAIFIAVTLFTAIYLTQTLNKVSSPLTYHEIERLQPPPPLAPPLPENKIENEMLLLPELKPSLQKLTLHPLEISLAPSAQEALSIGISLEGLAMETDSIGEIEEVFDFQDLSQSPSVVNLPRINYPRELIRRGIKKGQVVLIIQIDKTGKARLEQIISSTHSQLEPVAKDVVRQVRFTPPTINGTPVTVRGEWPLFLQAP